MFLIDKYNDETIHVGHGASKQAFIVVRGFEILNIKSLPETKVSTSFYSLFINKHKQTYSAQVNFVSQFAINFSTS